MMMEPLYPCDPEKNVACNKLMCFKNGGPCSMTFNPEYAIIEVPVMIDKSNPIGSCKQVYTSTLVHVESLESISRVLQKPRKDLTSDEISQYILDRCLDYEHSREEDNENKSD